VGLGVFYGIKALMFKYLSLDEKVEKLKERKVKK